MCECTGCQWCTPFHVEWDFARRGPIAGKQCYNDQTANAKRQCPHLTKSKIVCHWCLKFAVTEAEKKFKVMAGAASQLGPSQVYFAGASQQPWQIESALSLQTRVDDTKTEEEALTKDDGLRITQCLQVMNQNIKKLETSLHQRQKVVVEMASNVSKIHDMLEFLTNKFETVEGQLESVLPSAPMLLSASDSD